MGFFSGIAKAVAGPIIGAAGSLIGGKQSSNSAEALNAQNIALQREFAQKGIGWRVDDAKRSGVHPLYALGASTHTPSPLTAFAGDRGFSDAGQNIGRAIHAGLNTPDRQRLARSQEMAEERHKAELDLVRAQTKRILSQSQVPAPSTLPLSITANTSTIPGQETAGAMQGLEVQPNVVSPVLPGQPQSESGLNPDVRYIVTAKGIGMMPSRESGIEDQDLTSIPNLQWYWRNQWSPNWDTEAYKRLKPPKHMWKLHFPKAIDVEWNTLSGVWKPVYPGVRSGKLVHGAGAHPYNR